MNRGIVVGIGLLAFFLSGCGTVMNLRTPAPGSTAFQGTEHVPQEVYGGVKLDIEAGRRSFDEAEERPFQALVGAYVLGIDLPASAVADTFTLPITVRAAIGRAIDAYYFPQQEAHSETQAP